VQLCLVHGVECTYGELVSRTVGTRLATGQLTVLQIRSGVHQAQLHLSCHAHRPPPQLLGLQHLASPQVRHGSNVGSGGGISCFSPSAIPVCCGYPPGAGEEGSRKHHARTDVCVCDFQQSLHQPGMSPLPWFPSLTNHLKYFLWYMVFLPFYLPRSSLIRQPRRGWIALGLWVLGQVSLVPNIAPHSLSC